MKTKSKLDMEKIAKTLGAERRGGVQARGGHFGAAQLVAEVRARFKNPAGGGRPTDPSWSERRLIPLTPDTLERLEQLAVELSRHDLRIEPLQLAALLLERATLDVDEPTAEELVRHRSNK